MSLHATISVVVPTAGGGGARRRSRARGPGRAGTRRRRPSRRRRRRRTTPSPPPSSPPPSRCMRLSFCVYSIYIYWDDPSLLSRGSVGCWLLLCCRREILGYDVVRKGDVGPRVTNTLVFRVKRGTWEQRAGRYQLPAKFLFNILYIQIMISLKTLRPPPHLSGGSWPQCQDLYPILLAHSLRGMAQPCTSTQYVSSWKEALALGCSKSKSLT